MSVAAAAAAAAAASLNTMAQSAHRREKEPKVECCIDDTVVQPLK